MFLHSFVSDDVPCSKEPKQEKENLKTQKARNAIAVNKESAGTNRSSKVMLTEHEQMVEKAILQEDIMTKYIKASCHSPESCIDCKLMNQRDFISEKEKYDAMWNNCNAITQDDGTKVIQVAYQFRGDVAQMFPTSNMEAAIKNARNVARKAEQNGLSEVLETEIQSRVDRGILKQLSANEVESLKERHHNFC